MIVATIAPQICNDPNSVAPVWFTVSTRHDRSAKPLMPGECFQASTGQTITIISLNRYRVGSVKFDNGEETTSYGKVRQPGALPFNKVRVAHYLGDPASWNGSDYITVRTY